jgi:hypothetical protein
MTKSRKNKTKKQRVYKMIGCNKKNKSCRNKEPCPTCGPNCHCINCKCLKGCKGNCYLNRRLKGGSGCGPGGCPIPPLSWKQMQQFQGGSGIPGPFVGQPWTANSWPGQNGVSNDNNYLANYKDVVANDPSYHQSMNAAGYNSINSKVGGYTYDAKVFPKSKSKSKRSSSKSKSSSSKSTTSSYRTSDTINGGGLVPQDLVNLGRDFMYNLNSAYNALNGYGAPVNPLPYKDQLIHK